MSNGQLRVDKYKDLPVDRHLRMLDNDLDALDANREILLRTLEATAERRYSDISTKLNWVLTTFVSLILLVCGTLLAVVVRT